MSKIARCCRPQGAPYEWVDRLDPTHPSLIHLASWLRGMGWAAADEVEGRLEALEQLAAEGKLPAGSTKVVEPISRYRRMWELKLEVFEPRGKKRELRQYHGEPSSPSHVLVRLHRHIKRTHIAGLVTWFQDQEIDFADERFTRWVDESAAHKR